MRIYISADIEGIAGVVSRDNLSPGRFEYEPARDWMTEAVLSACSALRELGVDEVVVSDSHGTGQNIRYERMPKYVQLARSWPRPLGMMQGIEIGDYAGAMLIGYHAGATNIRGTLAHTINSEFIQEIRLNGATVSEAAISAAIAGHFGVPVLMAAGDDVFIEETQALLGPMATACLKTSTGFLSALTLSLEEADHRLRTGVKDAVARIGQIKPRTLCGPVQLDIRLRNRFMAEWLGYLSEVERLDAYTIRHTSIDIIGTSKFLEFVGSARSAVG